MIRLPLVLALILAAGVARAQSAEGADATLLRGVARFRAGDYAGAAAALGQAHAAMPSDLDVALLLGITYHRLGHDRAAEPLLESAARSADAETAASARIFLGLIAETRGDADEARRLLTAAAASHAPALAAGAHALLAARQQQRLRLVLLVQPEFDSNVPLLPLAPTPGSTGGQADGDLLALGAISLSPWRSVGLSLGDTAAYRQQFSLTAYDLFTNDLGARYAFLGAHDRVHLGYAFELTTLGGALLDFGQLADVGYRRRLFAELGIGIGYSFQYRGYRASYTPFTGPTHDGEVEVSWGTPERRWAVAAAYLIVREITADPTYTATGQGGRLRGHVRLGAATQLALTGWAIHRDYDAPDPTSGLRVDTQVYADLSLTVEIDRYLALVAGGSVLRNFSTIGDFDYLKATAHLGLVASWAGL